MGLSALDYWRLSEELSVVDAAILITGNNPETKAEELLPDGDSEWKQRTTYDGFDATFKALRNDILANRLKATLGMRARERVYDYSAYGQPEVKIWEGGTEFKFELILQLNNQNLRLFHNRKIDDQSELSDVYMLTEPDWTQTTVFVSDLKAWLDGKGIYPDFFFPKGKAEGFRERTHARYSPKLACAVEAWEKVTRPLPNKSVKESVSQWVQSNGVLFGMADGDGVVPTKAVEEVAKVVNWSTKGGAIPTYQGDEDAEAEEVIQNFSQSPLTRGMDDDIPF